MNFLRPKPNTSMGPSGSMTRPRSRHTSTFDVSIIWRHPVFLATFVLVIPGWLTAFVGMCVSEADLNETGGGPVAGVLWFAIWLQLALIIHLFLALANNTLPLHRLQLAIVIAILVPFAVGGVQDNLYLGEDRSKAKLTGGSALQAVGVGWLLISMVDLIWLLYLTSDPPSPIHSILTYFGDGGLHHPTSPPGLVGSSSYDRDMDMQNSSTRNLNPYGGGGGYEQAAGGGTPVKLERVGGMGGVEEVRGMTGGGAVAHDGVQYAARAKALYAYSASPDDPNEVSFAKGEILDIVDSSGKWWQCRTAAGAVGIAPSNYLQLF